ncbi:MAG: hypothetical protein J0M08_08160 [Bacteroidetes bacterium]|nr:hypothetical protein [Bacteroidota bacterium]
MIYTLYYGGGDTTNYYESGVAIANLLDVDYHKFFDILYNGEIDKRIHYFTNETGFPVYKRDVHSAFVSRIIAVFTLVGFKAYIPTTILLSFVCFIGNWKLYVLFIEYFPKIQKELFIALLAIPSILFWGAGISKDTITLSALGWYVYGFNKFFILKKDRIISGIYLGIASYLLIVIKPYIFFATLPGSVIWFFSDFTHRIGSKLIKFLIGPIFLSVAVLFSYYILLNFGENLGQYSLDNVFNKASTTQKDFKNNEAYSKNSFDIGDFEPTLAGSLKKAHLAIAAGLFRPYLWDARNAVMLLSALENTYIALLTFFLLLRLKFFGFFFLINKHPLLLFSFLFALFFAFAVGLSTANFGALVRLKIPCIPFFVASLFILKHLYQVKSGRKLGI